VTLRPWRAEDAPALVAAWADDEIRRHTAVPPDPSLAYAERWIAGEPERRRRGLAVDLVIDVDGAVAGEVGLDLTGDEPELGYWVAAPHRGQGLATAGVGLLVGWAFANLPIDRIVARPTNDASQHVLERAGYTPDGDRGLRSGAEQRHR
jgi:RimJ/RimL family protein N-acetyltransferase